MSVQTKPPILRNNQSLKYTSVPYKTILRVQATKTWSGWPWMIICKVFHFYRKTYVSDVLVHPGICNIPILDGQTLTNEEFLKKFAYQSPFVLRDATDNTVSWDKIPHWSWHSQYITSRWVGFEWNWKKLTMGPSQGERAFIRGSKYVWNPRMKAIEMA